MAKIISQKEAADALAKIARLKALHAARMRRYRASIAKASKTKRLTASKPLKVVK